MSLRRQLEICLAAYLRELVSDSTPTSLPVIEGRSAQERPLPCVVVYADREAVPGDFPEDATEIPLKVFVLTQADDEDVAAHDERAADIETWLLAKTSLIAALNLTAIGYHVHDIHLESTDDGREGRHFGDVFTLRAVLQRLGG
jgi:hypothetical protein